LRVEDKVDRSRSAGDGGNMRPHPAARPLAPTMPGLLGGLRRRARTVAYGTPAARLLPRIALTPEIRCPAVLLGCGEVRADVSDSWSLVGWDPVRVIVGLDTDDPLAAVLPTGASAALTMAPATRSGPRWRGHAASESPLGHLLLQVEEARVIGGRAVRILRATDAESHLLRNHQAWARRSRSGAADPAEAVAWACPRPIGLVTTTDGTDEHIFPVDLCGSLGGRLFALGLSPGSASLSAVVTAPVFVWSTVDASAGRSAHDLRIGHRRSGRGALSADVRHFKRTPERDLPLPMWALRSTELETLGRVDGARAIVICRQLETTRVRDAAALAHLHRDALAWRQSAGWETSLLPD